MHLHLQSQASPDRAIPAWPLRTAGEVEFLRLDAEHKVIALCIGLSVHVHTFRVRDIN